MADHIPIELSIKKDFKERLHPPDLADRGGLYKRLGIDLSGAKKSAIGGESEAPTERKEYSVPALEAMMSTWTYQAFKQEHSPNSDDKVKEEENIISDDEESMSLAENI